MAIDINEYGDKRKPCHKCHIALFGVIKITWQSRIPKKKKKNRLYVPTYS